VISFRPLKCQGHKPFLVEFQKVCTVGYVPDLRHHTNSIRVIRPITRQAGDVSLIVGKPRLRLGLFVWGGTILKIAIMWGFWYTEADFREVIETDAREFKIGVENELHKDGHFREVTRI
jgi:hypothetical protein